MKLVYTIDGGGTYSVTLVEEVSARLARFTLIAVQFGSERGIQVARKAGLEESRV